MIETHGIPLEFDGGPYSKSNGKRSGTSQNQSEPVPEAPHIPTKWPQPLSQAAFYGIAGDYVRLVEPASEADPAALLLQFLVGTGNLLGHGPYFTVEATRHYLNLYAVLVGLSSKSRKGTSWNQVKDFNSRIDKDWADNCLSSGLSSGEGLIEAIRDASGDPQQSKDFDPGVEDKRLLVQQGEFCSVLRMMERDGNTLSMVLRDGWDCETLRTMTRKSNKLRATETHISALGHITRDELRAGLTETDKANGFGNRILWACARRSKVLPDLVETDTAKMNHLVRQFAEVRNFANRVGQMSRDAGAREIWRGVYENLSCERFGMFGALTSRAEAQVLRLSMLYAVLDKSDKIQANHLLAALEVWRYCEDSARYIFGDALGDPVADAILAALREESGGLTRNQIRDLFGRNHSSARISSALDLLQEYGKIAMRKEPTEGRPREVWFASANTR